jgi:hypothetical protein
MIEDKLRSVVNWQWALKNEKAYTLKTNEGEENSRGVPLQS